MTMSMCKVICVTNRSLVKGDFLQQIEMVLALGVEAVILREKDLKEEEYRELAAKVQPLCEKYHTPLIVHTFFKTAKQLGILRVHLPYPVFEKEYMEWNHYTEQNSVDRWEFEEVGVSVHSVQEAVAAQQQGASYLTAGHIFATDCKRGLPPRGPEFLHRVCEAVEIPVYAIGGIHSDNEKLCMEAGAAGVCKMSSLMRM